jgi:phosphonate transport system substrate-binding protein
MYQALSHIVLNGAKSIMSYLFTVSPDFTPDHLSGWYIFNTWLQRQSGEAIHLEMYNNFQTQRNVIQRDQIDLIYANPFDAAMLVREKGFLPLVKAAGVSDEAIIAVKADNAVADVAHLSPGITVAVTEDPDVTMMGMIMLEAGDLDAGNIHINVYDTYVLVAKHLLKGDADVGIFLAEAYDDLSNMIKKQLRVLVLSQISVIHHSLMIGPKLADRRDEIQDLLVTMNHDEKGKAILKSLGFDAWVKVEDEEMEFMIDLMDALAT